MRQNDSSRNSQVRLNFSIDEELEAKLNAYEEATGRKQTAVIRQLLIEWLEEVRELPGQVTHPSGRRTNINVSARVRDALERKVTRERLPSLSGVVTALLRTFLEHRTPVESEESVTMRLRLPASLVKQFNTVCALREEDPAKVIADLIQARVQEKLAALKESS